MTSVRSSNTSFLSSFRKTKNNLEINHDSKRNIDVNLERGNNNAESITIKFNNIWHSDLDKHQNYSYIMEEKKIEAKRHEETPKNFFTRFLRNRPVSAPSSPHLERKSINSSINNKKRSNSPIAMPSKLSDNTTQLSFKQRIKLHKGIRTGKVPEHLMKQSQSQIFNQNKKIKEKIETKKIKNRAHSADEINNLNDANYLTQALLTIGEDQPVIARSTPKHAVIVIDERKNEERLRRDCLFNDEFYERMLSDSLTVCDLLKNHLDDCIAGVRARSSTALSSPFTSPPGTPSLTRSSSSQPFGEYNINYYNNFVTSALPPLSQNPPKITLSVSNAQASSFSKGLTQKTKVNGNFRGNTSLPPISPGKR